MERLKAFFVKFVKFGIVGFSGMVIDYGFLFLFKEVFGVPSLWANAFSFTLAATWNYFFNRIWTFRSQEKHVGVEYIKFIAVSIVGLGISTLSLWIMGLMLPEWYDDWRFYLLKLIAIAVTTIWNFFGNLLFTFNKKK